MKRKFVDCKTVVKEFHSQFSAINPQGDYQDALREEIQLLKKLNDNLHHTCGRCLCIKEHILTWPVCDHGFCIDCLNEYFFAPFTNEQQIIQPNLLFCNPTIFIVPPINEDAAIQTDIKFNTSSLIKQDCPTCKSKENKLSIFHHSQEGLKKLKVQASSIITCPQCNRNFSKEEMAYHMFYTCLAKKLPCPLNPQKNCQVRWFPMSTWDDPFQGIVFLFFVFD